MKYRCLFAVANSRRDPGVRAASDGHVWNVGSLRQGLRYAGQEEEDGDESSPQNIEPGVQ